jgi:4-hydroxybenzoate polyprenyltransferase
VADRFAAGRNYPLAPPPPHLPSLSILTSETDVVQPKNFHAVLFGFVRLARPKHYCKNSFILVPLLCYPPAWNLPNLLALLAAFTAFCLWSSSVYVFNDVIDSPRDALHPRKCKRPIPAGLIAPPAAWLFAGLLAAGAALLAYQAVSIALVGLGCLYLLNNVAYCVILRNKVILDVMSIAAGFVLRIFAGCVAVQVFPSDWMIICGFSLALLLGFGKRRVELCHNLEHQKNYRKSLDSYPVEFLNILIGVSSMMCLMSYMLYASSPSTIAIHGTSNLLYTTPFVMYGVFRYAIRCIQGRSDGPVDVLTRDKAFMINVLLWAGCVAMIVWRY